MVLGMHLFQKYSESYKQCNHAESMRLCVYGLTWIFWLSVKVDQGLPCVRYHIPRLSGKPLQGPFVAPKHSLSYGVPVSLSPAGQLQNQYVKSCFSRQHEGQIGSIAVSCQWRYWTKEGYKQIVIQQAARRLFNSLFVWNHKKSFHVDISVQTNRELVDCWGSYRWLSVKSWKYIQGGWFLWLWKWLPYQLVHCWKCQNDLESI